jgi:glucose/arabinose dehydrogenase
MLLKSVLAAAALAAAAAHAACPPLETRPPSASWQQPDFAGQTRACGVKSNVAFEVQVLAKGLEHPWSVSPLPNGDLLVTERPGRIRIVAADGRVGEPLAGVPPVFAESQTGLLGAAPSPTFETDRTIYWSYIEARPEGRGLTVARAVLSADGRGLEQLRVILRTTPAYAQTTANTGSRVVFGPDGMLYVTTGDNSHRHLRRHAQQLDSHLAKVLRITPEGKPAPGNPFADKGGALPEIWSLGHRNVQALAFDARGRLWVVDHGPMGGDELNLVEKGGNYGWPLVTFGAEYSTGLAISGSVTSLVGFERPVYYWDPAIAPSGAQFYTGEAFPAWRGSLLVGALRGTALVRLVMENDRVVGEEHLLADRRQRIRDVRQGKGGELYVITDSPMGEIWKIVPK